MALVVKSALVIALDWTFQIKYSGFSASRSLHPYFRLLDRRLSFMQPDQSSAASEMWGLNGGRAYILWRSE